MAPQPRLPTNPARWLAVAVSGLALASGCLGPRCEVAARNETSEPIERLTVSGCGVERELGPLSPGDERRMQVVSYYGHPCQLTYTGRQGQAALGGVLGTYETGARKLTLHLRPGGVGDVEDDAQVGDGENR